MIFRIRDEKPIPLAPNPTHHEDLQYATWGPKGSQLVFIHRDSIYYMDSAEGNPILIAETPEESVITNGIPDWLYEEEILFKSNAVWFSPGGTKICFASFNDSDVDVTSYPYYGSYDDPSNINPGLYKIRYPKVCPMSCDMS